MTEIEIKAWVKDRAEVTTKLNSFADYKSRTLKEDTYYTLGGSSPRIRIRKETIFEGNSRSATPRYTTLVTYKRKELRLNSDGTKSEVNEENEGEISNAQALELYLTDSGHRIHLRKHKDVMLWTSQSSAFMSNPPKSYPINIELCAVEHLGDFLEIEILYDGSDDNEVSALTQVLYSILEKAGLGADDVEDRYYSELLREKEATGV